jgi:DNA (cytosine-5)-methyltransferase 1
MGLDSGWVTAVPGLSRTAQLKALGNGVVPQQGAAAVRLLADRAGITPAQPGRQATGVAA